MTVAAVVAAPLAGPVPALTLLLATTANAGNSFTAASSFPTYPSAVGADAPWAYHRSEESPSWSLTPTASDLSGSSHPGTYNGAPDGPATSSNFHDDTGTSAADSSGTVDTGTQTNSPTRTAGRTGYALTFNGWNNRH